MRRILDFLFPKRVAERAFVESMAAAYGEASGRMADAGSRWLRDGGPEKSLEDAMLAEEPGASGALYGLALAEINRRKGTNFRN